MVTARLGLGWVWGEVGVRAGARVRVRVCACHRVHRRSGPVEAVVCEDEELRAALGEARRARREWGRVRVGVGVPPARERAVSRCAVEEEGWGSGRS